jgi:peptidoglycan hydrolase-like protein with peptidoglycan-binding domain
VQEQLTVLGYNPRGVDGVFGAGTRAALAAWQRNEGLEETGYLTNSQLALLGRQAKARSDALAAEAERLRQERAAADAAFWRSTGANGTAADFRAYLARYPDGIYAREARDGLERIEALEREQAERADRAAWDEARTANTLRSYQRYLDLYPRGAFAEIARARIRDLENDGTIEDDREELEAIEANLGLNAASRMLVERRLAALGHDPGPVDGEFTRRTRSAIRAFQQSRGLQATGFLNTVTVRQLIVAAAN